MTDGAAYYSGVMRCGSVWACPACSRKIRHERALEAEAGFLRWQRRGGAILFLTLTLPHDVGEACEELMSTVKLGWSRVMAGRPFRRDREEFRITHWYRGWDATHGGNGWHPHLHVALLVERPLSAAQVGELEERLFARWTKAVRERGHRAPSRDHGIHLEAARSAASLAGYLLKIQGEDSGAPIALEITRGDLKQGRGRTPFGILRDFAGTGDGACLALWHEWERATKGQHFTRWSNGAKASLGIADPSDAEIMERPETGVVVHTFTVDEWQLARARPGGLVLLLRAAERRGSVGVKDALAKLGHQFNRELRPTRAPP